MRVTEGKAETDHGSRIGVQIHWVTYENTQEHPQSARGGLGCSESGLCWNSSIRGARREGKSVFLARCKTKDKQKRKSMRSGTPSQKRDKSRCDTKTKLAEEGNNDNIEATKKRTYRRRIAAQWTKKGKSHWSRWDSAERITITTMIEAPAATASVAGRYITMWQSIRRYDEVHGVFCSRGKWEERVFASDIYNIFFATATAVFSWKRLKLSYGRYPFERYGRTMKYK